ncbi:MAG: glycerophosphodiester phosphodiesterase [Halodesulfurarchaeum sp.]|nr:glycerophosphodiester phosphodiesterase [Halodesulfurarchaeum sp.]
MDVICHRACPAGGPENSLPAVRAVPDWVDMVEVDVQRCASGELVVFHDRVLDRVTAGTGAIAGTDWKDLEELQLEGTDATVPRLASLIEALPPGIGLNVELKHAGMATDLAPILKAVDRKVLVSSFVPQAIVPLSKRGFQTAHLIQPDQSSRWESELAAAESVGAEAVHPHFEAVDSAAIEAAHDRGLAVNAWTVPDESTVNRLREAGVDGVIVDDWRLVESA